MQCPSCGNTDLLPKFNYCPQCGSPLPRASNAPKKDEGDIARSTGQQSPAANNAEFRVDNGQIQGNHLCFQFLFCKIKTLLFILT